MGLGFEINGAQQSRPPGSSQPGSHCAGVRPCRLTRQAAPASSRAPPPGAGANFTLSDQSCVARWRLDTGQALFSADEPDGPGLQKNQFSMHQKVAWLRSQPLQISICYPGLCPPRTLPFESEAM